MTDQPQPVPVPTDDLPLFPGREVLTRVLCNPAMIYPREMRAASEAMASIGHRPVFSPPNLDEAVAALRREARRHATGRVAELLAQADALVAMSEQRHLYADGEVLYNPDMARKPAPRGWWRRLMGR